ncbi:MAG: GNAT family N-acetyltransferase, partial [Anaerolineae bacterium]|nr:GNAT family N-acetyltransferase [Anaerolineae bacterium]
LAIEAEDGVHIGNIGLDQINWKDRSAELGIVIGEKSQWSKGYGTDAIRTLLGLGFREMNLHRIFLRVDADNARGIRCYEKAGFQLEGTFREAVFREGVYHDQRVMSILQTESTQDVP